MAVIAVDITRQEPYSHGQSFGQTGAYERIEGVITAAVDPAHRANQAIVDLPLAPRDEQGRVRFQADFTLLKPLDTSRGNRRLLVDVVNRGRIRAVPTLNMAPAPPEGSRAIPPGDGFLFAQGYTVVSIGWQWDVHRSDALLGLVPPFADLAGEPDPGQAIVEIRPNAVETTRLLADRIHQPYPAADVEDPEAVLLVREWKDGPATVVPRHQWRFARETDAGVVPSAEHIYLASGFQPGLMYYVVYRTGAAPVVGTGLLAVRDVAAWLRHASALNPVAEGFERVYALGISQTGRLLRHFIYLGLNLDESDRLVYDGLLPHIAGGRRGEFNHRFAQPSQQHTPGFGHLFPFADNAMTDVLSGRTDGLLNQLRSQQAVPKILYTNSSAEYWRGDASLLHTDPAGQTDVEPAAETRLYHFAGTQHTAGTLPQASGSGPDGATGRYASNVTDYRPLLRAALINLDRWVSEGIEPPPNRHPRLDDGTAVPRAEALETFNMIPGVVPADPDRLWRLRDMDLGPDADRGIGRYPADERHDYPCYVSSVDSDGNERAGIRLPDLVVPVATHAGWNPRAPETGAPEQIIPMQGFSIFFAPDKVARQAVGDPRPSIEERYANRDAYLAQVRAVAQQLAAERYLLGADVETVVSACEARYDAALKHLTAV